MRRRSPPVAGRVGNWPKLRTACAALVALHASPAWAEGRVTHTPRGVPLDEPRTVEAQGRTFRIPAGCLHSWYFPEPRGQVLKRGDFGYHFWMPTRRCPEVEMVSTPSFRPREKGRPPPGPDEYTVSVVGFEFAATKQPGWVSPVETFRNYTRNLGGLDAFAFRERFGLVEFWRPNAPNARLNYRHVEGTEPSVDIDCPLPEHAMPNPLCRCHAYFADDDLSLNLWFSRNDVERWRENVMTARELILEWSAAPKP